VSTRIQRPHPKRLQPVRNAAAMLRARQAPYGPTHTHTHPGIGEDGASPTGAVEQGVATAYRVYDDYMRRGREAAASGRLFDLGGATSEGARPMNNDVQNLTKMAMRYWSDAFAMWIDLVAPLVPQGMGDALRTGVAPAPGAAPSAWNPATPPPGADPAVWTIPDRGRASADGASPAQGTGTVASPGRVAVAVEVRSQRPARVIVELSPAAAGRPLAALPLSPIDGSAKPALTAVSLKPAGDQVDVSVVVGADQPAGTYVGVVLDTERGTAAGTLTVVLSG
jgi:hypothetical protein